MSYRDARTGEYVTEEFAKANPDTTVYVASPAPPLAPEETPYCPWCGVPQGGVHLYEVHFKNGDPATRTKP